LLGNLFPLATIESSTEVTETDWYTDGWKRLSARRLLDDQKQHATLLIDGGHTKLVWCVDLWLISLRPRECAD
jgi:hypothetical protein